MSAHKALSVPDVIEYVQGISGMFSPQASLTGHEIGDGNMNFVFRVAEQHRAGRSVIVKQALPYMRSVGATWPLTANRIRIEYEALVTHHKICPGLVPKVYHYDDELSLLVMEDLTDHSVLRKRLVSGQHYPQLGLQLGIFLARTLFLTSRFALDEMHMELKRQRFENTDMVKITSDFVFTFPFTDHPMNRCNPAIRRMVEDIWNDRELQDAVAELKRKFTSDAQALLHGDLHTGSIMVSEQDTKVIDPEFAFYGPMGFDVGNLVANLLLCYCSHKVDKRSLGNHQGYLIYLLKTIEKTWLHFEAEFRDLWAQHASHDYTNIEDTLAQVWEDSLGFAGCEMIRRVTGTSHVLDLEQVEDASERARGETLALRLGRGLILQRNTVRNIQDLTGFVQQVGEAVRFDRQ